MTEVSSDQGHQEDDLEDSSDVSGYHSDSDSAVMMSGNSPFLSKSARYNFLSRSGNVQLSFSYSSTFEDYRPHKLFTCVVMCEPVLIPLLAFIFFSTNSF